MIFFSPFFSLLYEPVLPDQPPTGLLKAVRIASDFCSPDEGTKKKPAGEERRVCFVLMRILSPPAGETAGVLSCPSSPALASPVLHLLAAARRREGFVRPGISELTVLFLARCLLGEPPSRL